MSESLVARVRYHIQKANFMGLKEAESTRLLDEAADAIEELSKLADAIPHVCECCVGCELEKKNGGCDNAFVLSPKRAMQYLIKPRWIPVTERLPDEDGKYLCTVRSFNNKQYRYVDIFVFQDGCFLNAELERSASPIGCFCRNRLQSVGRWLQTVTNLSEIPNSWANL